MTILIPQLSGRASTMGDLSFVSGQRCYTLIYEGVFVFYPCSRVGLET